MVELQVRDVLKVSEIAREQGQVMLKGSRCNKDIQIADLPTDGPGKCTPHDGKAFHDSKGEREDVFACKKVP